MLRVLAWEAYTSRRGGVDDDGGAGKEALSECDDRSAARAKRARAF